MDRDELFRNAHKLIRKYRVTGADFHLRDIDPADTGGLNEADKPRAKEALQAGVEALTRLQEMLYAQDRWALLVILQAMDAAGKDGAIEHVMSGVNPQGCQVVSFKAPSREELDHDFLWRCQKEVPERGRIGIFNRSYYEEALVVRVHRELLERQNLPPRLVTDRIWDERYQDMRGYERYLCRNGIVVRKLFLHVSRGEQKRRFLARIEDPSKQWKFSTADVGERALWKQYMRAYELMIRGTATRHAPWFVIPADNKWFTRIIVAAVIVDALKSLDLHYPRLTREQQAELAKVKKLLRSER
jgi:PPK2 family polyphosphate:nucleotide phosphotransferase